MNPELVVERTISCEVHMRLINAEDQLYLRPK